MLCVFPYFAWLWDSPCHLYGLQVFDLLIHRVLEFPSLAELYLEELLTRYGALYKFHG